MCRVKTLLLALTATLIVTFSIAEAAKADLLHFELSSPISHFSFDLDRHPQNVTAIDGFPVSFNVPNVTIANIDAQTTFVVPFLAFGGLDDAGGGFAGSSGVNFAGDLFSFFGPQLFSGDVLSPTFITSPSGSPFQLVQFRSSDSQFFNADLTVTATSPVPGPAVGAGIPGVATALVGLFFWQRRRRQAAFT